MDQPTKPLPLPAQVFAPLLPPALTTTAEEYKAYIQNWRLYNLEVAKLRDAFRSRKADLKKKKATKLEAAPPVASEDKEQVKPVTPGASKKKRNHARNLRRAARRVSVKREAEEKKAAAAAPKRPQQPAPQQNKRGINRTPKTVTAPSPIAGSSSVTVAAHDTLDRHRMFWQEQMREGASKTVRDAARSHYNALNGFATHSPGDSRSVQEKLAGCVPRHLVKHKARLTPPPES